MTPEACHMLRHDINPRWIGDLLAAFCATCNHLFVPLPSSTPAIAAVSPRGRVRSGRRRCQMANARS